MKQILIYAATAIALFGCSDDPDSSYCPDNKDEAIRVEAILANVKPVSRTTIDNTGKAAWANGDVLGLFCAQAKPSAASNVSFTVAGLPGTPAWTPANQIYWADATTQHSFLAYAPYASGNSSATGVKLPSLTPQTGTVNPSQDFLISNASANVVRPVSGGAVTLNFTHALSLVDLQITAGSSLATGTTLQSVAFAAGASAQLYTTDATSTINLSTGAITLASAPASTTNTLTLTPSTPPVLSAAVTHFYIVVLPGTYALTVQIALSEGETSITVPVANIASTTFAAGSKYGYTVALSRTGITLSNPTITDWASVPSGSVNGGI